MLYNIKFRQMEADLFISMLGRLSQEAIEDIEKLKVEAECVFTYQPNCEDEDQFVQSEVIGDFLVECMPKTRKIGGGIPITLDYKFQIKRFPYDPNSELGKPYGFVLYFPQKQEEDDQIAIKLGVNIQGGDTLQKFAKCLQSKEIFQYDIHNNYKITERLFWSSSSALYSATRLRDNKQIVIKCVRKDHFQKHRRDLKKGLNREYGIPRKLKSPYICKFYSVYENDTSIYIVMEKLPLNFLQYLKMSKFTDKYQIKQIFYKVCLAINELHIHGIMHRDIKPQNIMLRPIKDTHYYEPVLIDFGLAEFDGIHPYIFVKGGTPGYVAPQVMNAKQLQPDYDRSCDIFSLGSMLHLLLLHKPLFEAYDAKQLLQINKKCQINEEHPKYSILKPQQKNLLFRMLEKDSSKRITIKQILEHQYFEQKNDKNKPVQNNQISQSQTVERDPLDT